MPQGRQTQMAEQGAPAPPILREYSRDGGLSPGPGVPARLPPKGAHPHSEARIWYDPAFSIWGYCSPEPGYPNCVSPDGGRGLYPAVL